MRRALALTMAVVAVGLVVACDVLLAIDHGRDTNGYSTAVVGSVSLPVWVAIGLLLILRVRGHVLGWVALAVATLDGVHLFGAALAAFLALHGGAPSAVDGFAGVSMVTQIGVVGGLIVFGQLAPDGRPVSRRWWPLTALTVVGLLLIGIATAARDSDVNDLVSVARAPLGAAPVALMNAFRAIAGVLVFVGIGTGAAGLVVRWRRGAGEQRQQIKWVLFTGLAAAFLVSVVQPIGDRLWPTATIGPDIMWSFVAVSLPAGTAIAVLRYRLYDIDRIVSRTVGYALVTGVLAGVYVGCVALTTQLLPLSSSFGVAASTLAAAALFQPVRRRVQSAVDRRFNRQRYDASRVVEAFSVRLRDQVDALAVRADLLTTVDRVVQPGGLSLWLAGDA